MQKAARHFSAIAGRVLFIGFTMQIVLGLIWMCCNIGRLEDHGLPMQLVLLLVAFSAGLFLVKTITETKKIVWMVWGSLAMLTVPMSLQCHLMNPKESIIGSFLVFQLAFLWGAIRNKAIGSYHSLATVSVFWVLESVIAPEYVLLGAVPVILLFLHGLRERKILYRLLLICAFGGMIFGINNLKQEKTQDTRMIYEVSADLFGRCTWTTIFRDSLYWTDEMYATVGEEILISTSLYADNMNELFKPAVLQNLGEEGAISFYQELTIAAVKEFPVQIMKECLWDAFAYSVPPVGAYLFLDGEGYDSYCPVNFDLMRRQAPRLTGYYMDYSCKWFVAAMVLAGGNAVLWRMFGANKNADRTAIKHAKCRKNTFAVVAIIITCTVIVLHHTLQGAGIMDYRKTVTICSVWVVWMISTMIRQPKESN